LLIELLCVLLLLAAIAHVDGSNAGHLPNQNLLGGRVRRFSAPTVMLHKMTRPDSGVGLQDTPVTPFPVQSDPFPPPESKLPPALYQLPVVFERSLVRVASPEQGAGGDVYFATSTAKKPGGPDANAAFAVKMAQKETEQASWVEYEANVMTRLVHSNIIRAYARVQGKNRVGFTMEMMHGGNLYHLPYKLGRQLTELEVGKVAAGLFPALAYMHGLGFVHRDIKSENIFLNWDPTSIVAKFGDFAYALYGDGARHITQVKGTAGFLSPQALLASDWSPYDGFPADIYALGVTLLESVVRIDIPSDYGGQPLMISVDWSPEIKDLRQMQISESFVQLLLAMCSHDPTKRPTAKELVNHAWFQRMKRWKV